MWVYALCFSTNKACSYWNTETLGTVAEGRWFSFWEWILVWYFTRKHEPGGDVNIVFTINTNEMGYWLCFKQQSSWNSNFRTLDSYYGCQINACFGCIFQRQKSKGEKSLKYFILGSSRKRAIDLFEKICDAKTVVEKSFVIAEHNLKHR